MANSYSIFYRIYRRIRYLRYLRRVKKKRKASARELESKYKEELKRINKDLATDNGLIRKIDENKAKSSYNEHNDEFEITEIVNEELLKSLDKTAKSQLKQQKENEAYERKRRKRLIRYLIKRRIKLCIKAIRDFDIESLKNFFVNQSKISNRNREMLVIFVNSLAYYILSFLLLFFTTSFIAALVGSFYDYHVVMLHFINYYYVGEMGWSSDAVVTIFSIGPISALILAVISWMVYYKIKEHPSRIKIFFIWISVHGFTFFFGALLTGSLLSFGFGFALAWSYVMDTAKLIYALGSIFFLVMIGLLLAPGIIISANSYFSKINSDNIPRFIFGQIILPFIFGNLILFLFWLPEISYYNQMITISTFFILAPIIAKAKTSNDMFFEEDFSFPSVDKRVILLTLLLFISFRIIFGIGISI